MLDCLEIFGSQDTEVDDVDTYTNPLSYLTVYVVDMVMMGCCGWWWREK